MNQKVAIVNPKTKNTIETNEPLSALSLATYLKHDGVEVKIIDEVAGENVDEVLDCFEPGLVGFTCTTCSYPRAVELLKKVKEKGYKTIIGGVHVSAAPEDAIKDGFDTVVVGEGERLLLEMVKSEVPKGVVYTPKDKLLTSEEILLPDRSLIDMEFYCTTKDRVPDDPNLDFVPLGQRMVSMLTSRGCPYDCVFCHNTWRGIRIRLMKADVILEEVKRLQKEYRVNYVWFIDDDFFMNKKRIMDFCNSVLEQNVVFYWATSARPDSLDEEVVKLAYQAGCRRLALGFESGSQRIVDILNKKLSVKKNLEITKLCKKYNIDVLGLIMVGNPTETKEDIALTWDFIKKAQFDSIAISVTTPFPGTQLWQWCKEKGHIPNHVDFSEFYYTRAPIQIPDTFTPQEVESIKRKLLIKTYLTNSRIRNRFIRKALAHPVSMSKKLADYIPFMQRKNK